MKGGNMSNSTRFMYCLSMMLMVMILSDQSFGQIYSFPEIKAIFLRERPQTGDLDIRKDCFGSIDDLILGTYPPLHSDTRPFYKLMIRKAIIEIENEIVKEGATIWQIYNHGFVIKTPSATFGCDLFDYFFIPEFINLANLIDAYFISHEHGDHHSGLLINEMIALGKPVVGPAEFSRVSIGMNPGESRMIAGLAVTAHDGLHGNIAIRQFEIVTPEGLKFLHTGDNQTSETLPSISDIDVMMLNCWINESGSISWVLGVRIAVNKMKPVVTLPGHMMELGHLGSQNPPVPYRDPIASDNGTLASEYCILGWGERYHYGQESNDTVKPNTAEHLTYTLSFDTMNFTW